MLNEVLEVWGSVGEDDRDRHQRDDYREHGQQPDLRGPLKPRDAVDEPDHPERRDQRQREEKERPVRVANRELGYVSQDPDRHGQR